jgi:hypothetical protein
VVLLLPLLLTRLVLLLLLLPWGDCVQPKLR